MYARPRYPANMTIVGGRSIHGKGSTFDSKISKAAKTELKACLDILDHAVILNEDIKNRIGGKFIPEKGVANVEEDARRLQYTIVTRNAKRVVVIIRIINEGCVEGTHGK